MIAFGYYGNILREIWMSPVPHGDTTRIRIPGSIAIALGLTSVATIVFGVIPGVALHFGDLARITGAFGG